SSLRPTATMEYIGHDANGRHHEPEEIDARGIQPRGLGVQCEANDVVGVVRHAGSHVEPEQKEQYASVSHTETLAPGSSVSSQHSVTRRSRAVLRLLRVALPRSSSQPEICRERPPSTGW